MDLDQKTLEKRPKIRSKFVKSTNSCHWEFSSSFWCVVFSLLALDFYFIFGTKTQTNLITPGNQVFKRFFFYSNGFFLSGFSFWLFPDLWFHEFFWPLWPSYFDFSFFFCDAPHSCNWLLHTILKPVNKVWISANDHM